MKKKNKKAAGSGSGSNAAGNTGSSGSASKKTENTAVKEQKMNIREKFTNLYLLSLFSLFPIFMTKKLFHVRTDRLYFFITATIALLVLTAGAYIFGKDKKHLRTVYQMSVSDWSFIAFTGIFTDPAGCDDGRYVRIPNGSQNDGQSRNGTCSHHLHYCT